MGRRERLSPSFILPHGGEAAICWDLLPNLTLGISVQEAGDGSDAYTHLRWVCSEDGETLSRDVDEHTGICTAGCWEPQVHQADNVDVNVGESHGPAYELITRGLDAHGVSPLTSCMLAEAAAEFIIHVWTGAVFAAQEKFGATGGMAAFLAWREVSEQFEDLAASIRSEPLPAGAGI